MSDGFDILQDVNILKEQSLETKADSNEDTDGAEITDGELDHGEREYALARMIDHNAIPTWSRDREYLTLLGKSAEHGSPWAMAKLGEYAMRRQMFVEAYFWMWKARRAGMQQLDTTLKTIRMSWIRFGRRDESRNVHPLFTAEDGSVARALLDLFSGYNTTEARGFLQEHHPECLK